MSQTITGPTTEHPSVAALTESERYRVLEAERRRLILAILAERMTPIDLLELATEIVAREAGPNATDEEAIERVAITLHHTHLPILDEKGVVDYDLRSQRIAPTW